MKKVIEIPILDEETLEKERKDMFEKLQSPLSPIFDATQQTEEILMPIFHHLMKVCTEHGIQISINICDAINEKHGVRTVSIGSTHKDRPNATVALSSVAGPLKGTDEFADHMMNALYSPPGLMLAYLVAARQILNESQDRPIDVIPEVLSDYLINIASSMQKVPEGTLPH